MRAFVLVQGEPAGAAVGDQLCTVRAGETALDPIFGLGHFDHVARNHDARATFHRARWEVHRASGHLLEGYDVERHRLVMGGGERSFPAPVLGACPRLRGILFDLPGTAREAQRYLSSTGVAGRCEIQSGSAFEAFPAGGDAYRMSRVLHDVSDEKGLVLPRNCRTVVPEEGVLLLREGFSRKGSWDPFWLNAT